MSGGCDLSGSVTLRFHSVLINTNWIGDTRYRIMHQRWLPSFSSHHFMYKLSGQHVYLWSLKKGKANMAWMSGRDNKDGRSPLELWTTFNCFAFSSTLLTSGKRFPKISVYPFVSQNSNTWTFLSHANVVKMARGPLITLLGWQPLPSSIAPFRWWVESSSRSDKWPCILGHQDTRIREQPKGRSEIINYVIIKVFCSERKKTEYQSRTSL